MTLEDALAECPLVAILRGLLPDEALEHADALHQAGLRVVEVPLNSPDPFESIRRIADAFGDRMAVGAGTVLSARQVDAVADAGGRLAVAPNTDPVRRRPRGSLRSPPAPGTSSSSPQRPMAPATCDSSRPCCRPTPSSGPSAE
jgi:2-dehydro-3-deoxyphosphogalactonate aldolase